MFALRIFPKNSNKIDLPNKLSFFVVDLFIEADGQSIQYVSGQHTIVSHKKIFLNMF